MRDVTGGVWGGHGSGGVGVRGEGGSGGVGARGEGGSGGVGVRDYMRVVLEPSDSFVDSPFSPEGSGTYRVSRSLHRP